MTESADDPSPEYASREVAEPLRRAIGERYLTYALSTIMHRALPDARDGLKPVHRRILYAMRELKLGSGGGFRKSAKIAGDVMGNYHPHGDAAIYDAMARLAQDFAVRYPLVDGQGNFGNIDGDNPAASRYTEARMTAAAEALMEGLGENTVDFRDNYDGTLTEPVVLPASFPNLLANGASGIAVGMATNIPPHNIAELCNACLHLIERPDARDDTLMNHVPGPDFPTGGVIVEPCDSLRQTYRTGRGSIRLRCRWEREQLGRGQWQIVVTEIPYQVQKSRLIEKLAELIQTRKVPILADVRDESADDVRIVLDPKSKNVDPDVLMNALFRQSDLEIRFGMNVNALIDGRTPKVCSMKEVLRAFLDHAREVLIRRSRHRLDRIGARLEVLEGYIVAFLNLDRVIAIIRTEDEPSPVMIEEFDLTETQVEAILNMRLRRLRKLEEMELKREHEDLLLEREGLIELLDSEALQWDRIAERLRLTRKEFGKDHEAGARRTGFAEVEELGEIPVEAMIEREPITVACSKMCWIRAMSGHIALDRELRFRDGDASRFTFHAETTDRLLIFGTNGRFYTIGATSLPGGRGMGEPLRLMIDLPNEADIVALFIHKPGRRLLVASSAGDGFVVAENDVIAQTRNGKQVLNVKGDVRAVVCKPIQGDRVVCVGENRKMLVFPLDELPEMARGKGVRLQKFRDGGLADADTFDPVQGISWHDPAGRTHTRKDLDEWVGKRSGAGRMAPRGFPRDNRFTECR